MRTFLQLNWRIAAYSLLIGCLPIGCKIAGERSLTRDAIRAGVVNDDSKYSFVTGRVFGISGDTAVIEGNGGQVKYSFSAASLTAESLVKSFGNLKKGGMIHIVADHFEIDDPTEIQKITARKIYHLKDSASIKWPGSPSFNLSIIGETPFSRRTLLFAKVYDQMAKGISGYINEDKLISVFHYEPSVMAGLHLYLIKLESVRGLIQKIKTTGATRDNLQEAWIYASRWHVLEPALSMCGLTLKSRDSFFGLLSNAAKPEECIKKMDRLYSGLTDLNLYLFTHNAGESLSPYIHYFSRARGDIWFNGRAEFPDDQNGILTRAFYELFLTAHVEGESIDIKRKRMEIFNLLVIGHEQILAQSHYDQMLDLQEKIAGYLTVTDRIGTYQLSTQSWGALSVRMALDKSWDGKRSEITPQVLLGNTHAKGSIPAYFKDRLYNPEVIKFHATDTLVDGIELPETPQRFDDAKSIIKFAGCNGCHAIRGISDQNGSDSMAGPSLIGLDLTADQIHDSIINPDGTIAVNQKSRQPYPAGVMPKNFGQILTEKEISAIIQWLKAM